MFTSNLILSTVTIIDLKSITFRNQIKRLTIDDNCSTYTLIVAVLLDTHLKRVTTAFELPYAL